MAAREIPVAPFWLQVGEGLNEAMGHHYDAYFEEEAQDSELGLLLDRFMEELPDVERVCVDAYVFAKMSYAGIARHMDWTIGDPPYPNRKRAWRATKRGVDKLRKQLLADARFGALAESLVAEEPEVAAP